MIVGVLSSISVTSGSQQTCHKKMYIKAKTKSPSEPVEMYDVHLSPTVFPCSLFDGDFFLVACYRGGTQLGGKSKTPRAKLCLDFMDFCRPSSQHFREHIQQKKLRGKKHQCYPMLVGWLNQPV